MSDRSRSPEPEQAPAPVEEAPVETAAAYDSAPAPVAQMASSETQGEEVKLYLGNLSYDTDEKRIEEKFREAGNVVEVFLPLDRQSGRVRGFGFCTMASKADADKAIAMFDGSDVDGRMIRVTESRPKGAGASGGNPAGSFNAAGVASRRIAT